MVKSFREAEHDGWVARAASYDEAFTTITNQAIPHVLAALGDVAGKDVLDVCCGPGHLAAAAAERGARVVGVDFASTMVGRARANHPAIDFREGDAEDLRFPDQAFDGVACAFGIMHLPHAERAIGEAQRVLRPGGVYVFTQWGLDDDLLRMVAGAVKTHGEAAPALPEAPPMMRFSDPGECRRVLEGAGFDRAAAELVALEWRTRRAQAVLDLIYAGAVRAALMIEAQDEAARARIRGAIVAAAEAKRSPAGEIVIRRPVVLASGRKGH
jgi:SAM-dependent methyltransferase